MRKTETMTFTPLFCDCCSVELHPGAGDFYVVRIEAVADPTPPSFIQDNFERNHRQAIEHLIEQAEELSAQELVDQVYRRLMIYLCTPCYRKWIENPTGSL